MDTKTLLSSLATEQVNARSERLDQMSALEIVTLMNDVTADVTAGVSRALPALAEPLAGGWQVAESAEVTEDALEAFSIAAEALDGVAYEPIALLGTQVVAGMNYCILCRAWPVVADAPAGFVLAYVYADLEGNAAFTHFADIDIAALAQGE